MISPGQGQITALLDQLEQEVNQYLVNAHGRNRHVLFPSEIKVDAQLIITDSGYILAGYSTTIADPSIDTSINERVESSNGTNTNVATSSDIGSSATSQGGSNKSERTDTPQEF